MLYCFPTFLLAAYILWATVSSARSDSCTPILLSGFPQVSTLTSLFLALQKVASPLALGNIQGAWEKEGRHSEKQQCELYGSSNSIHVIELTTF